MKLTSINENMVLLQDIVYVFHHLTYLTNPQSQYNKCMQHKQPTISL